MKKYFLLFSTYFLSLWLSAQTPVKYYLTADRVFDGENMHEGWAVITEGDKIVAAGPKDKLKEPAGATRINFPNSTLTPGLIE